MRRSAKPTPIKPELVNPQDMIEVKWEQAGIQYSVTAYVGSTTHLLTGSDHEIMAANGRTRLIAWSPQSGISWPDRHAQIYRHRLAPQQTGLFDA